MTISACILSVSGEALTPDEAALFAEQQPWGVILMGRSCKSKEQVRRLVSDIRQAIGRECLIFIDQEGGRVARLKSPEWPKFPRGLDYADVYARDIGSGKEAAWLGYRLIAHELSEMSINANCAPVLDVPVPGAHDVIGDRALGDRPEVITLLAGMALKGLTDGGVAGVIKHIPGHGRSMVDSHKDLPRVTASKSELATDFDAFASLADAPMAMSAHIVYEAFDANRAATVSDIVINDVIRGEIGFDGLLMTDDLGMNALGGTLTDRAESAINAGCDVLLHCSGFLSDPDEILSEMREVAEAAPALTGKSAERALRAEAATKLGGPLHPADLEQAWAKFHTYFPALEAAA